LYENKKTDTLPSNFNRQYPKTRDVITHDEWETIHDNTEQLIKIAERVIAGHETMTGREVVCSIMTPFVDAILDSRAGETANDLLHHELAKITSIQDLCETFLIEVHGLLPGPRMKKARTAVQEDYVEKITNSIWETRRAVGALGFWTEGFEIKTRPVSLEDFFAKERMASMGGTIHAEGRNGINGGAKFMLTLHAG